MKQIKYENNKISHKRSKIKSIIDDFREFIIVYGFKYYKKKAKYLKKIT